LGYLRAFSLFSAFPMFLMLLGSVMRCSASHHARHRLSHLPIVSAAPRLPIWDVRARFDVFDAFDDATSLCYAQPRAMLIIPSKLKM
jgi:hypothetical protein